MTLANSFSQQCLHKAVAESPIIFTDVAHKCYIFGKYLTHARHTLHKEKVVLSGLEQTADMTIEGHLALREEGVEKHSNFCLSVCQEAERSRFGDRTLRS